MWKWLKFLFECLSPRNEDAPVEPTLERQIGLNELHALLLEKFPQGQIFLSDNVKHLCNYDDIDAFLEKDETNHYTYRAEALDCDDFTYILMGQLSTPGWAELAKGIVWTDKHALLGFVDINLDFWWIEPQTDKIQSKLEPWQGEKIRVIMM